MAYIETGVFIFMVLFSFGFMVWAVFRTSGMFTNILRLVSITMFFGLALFITSGVGVAATHIETVQENLINPLTGTLVPTTSTINTTDVFIPEGSDGAWMGYVFLAFAFINMALMVQDQWKLGWNK